MHGLSMTSSFPTHTLASFGVGPSLKERLNRVDRTPEPWIDGLRSLSQGWTRQALTGLFDFEVVGREHLPTDRSFVMVSNHSSHLDAPCLQAALPWSLRHRTFAAAAADYFFDHTAGALAAVVGVNAVPFDRQGGGAESLQQCRDLLQGPEPTVLVIFPEGTRSPDGELGRFRSGVGRLVAGTDVPVVPCRLDGAFQALPKGARRPRPAKLRLHIGEAVTGPADGEDRAAVQTFVEGLREVVVAL